MKTCSPYISIILDGEEFEAEKICRINKFAEDKDWSIRQLLHTIFSDPFPPPGDGEGVFY